MPRPSPPPGSRPALATLAAALVVALGPAAAAAPASQPAGEVLTPRPERWRLITARNPVGREPRRPALRYLAALGGLDAGYLLGWAKVRSDATDSGGRTYTVASGDATTRGYRFDLSALPTRSSVFVYPTLGFLSLDVDIRDFRQAIPMVSVPGATDIPGVGSDAATGEPLDLGDPNVYRLELRSVFAGQRLSATLLAGTSRVQLFATFEGGFNLIELRHARVRLGRYETAGWSFPWFFSAQVRAIAGLIVRPWHLALRCEAHWEGYRRYEFPEAIEFSGRTEYDRELQHYVRPRTFVGAASVHVFNLLFSLNLFL